MGTMATGAMGGVTADQILTDTIEATVERRDIEIMIKNFVSDSSVVIRTSNSANNHIIRIESGQQTDKENGNEDSLFHNIHVGVSRWNL
jgi:hypothetical protein